MTNEVLAKLKSEYQHMDFSSNDIPNLINGEYLKDDNMKYMRMYNWMSRFYDFVETVGGRIKFGNQVNQMRQEMISKLEWKDSISVLNISIGTGKDLEFIPKEISLKSLKICGVDISLGMLKKCKKKYHRKIDLSLLNCCAEDLPFQDNTFDMVFHVGGINFFTDKRKAIHEMIRVAKENTKILIADETNELIEQLYKKSFFIRKYTQDKSMDLDEMEKLIPMTVKEMKTDILWGGRFYCITFRK
jgi:ubiquinone/menaquinone biosynthesis C-methylase UbiE